MFPDVDRLTKNAPTNTPGQTQPPRSRQAASARPVGGQIAVALALTKARDRPNLPATM
jgi:hypothetical protein